MNSIGNCKVVLISLYSSDAIGLRYIYSLLKEKGFDVNLARLAEEIRVRDARDAQRDASPLKPADDAQIVDTSSLTVAQVVGRILDLLRERQVALRC